ncbi:nck-associated protein 5-like isoform X2 [Dunckerocampus dactyliophorus]|uniref:nck-associated protein 5-like isoform X2 n=1 Tax=Dunckerocampus dactyliophorus TaxID=161453 RepID=UPI002406FABC|nr:nck-associated protein 5-like isoform X2 [Dunckerocampus dactyliophorus]
MLTQPQHFSRMEETVRTLLQNQDSLEGPGVDPLDLMKAYKDKLLEEMWKQQDSLEGPTATEAEISTSLEASGGSEENSNSNSLLGRLRALEAENSALSLENDNQRKQYERCLDEVANQVVQALLTQKDLKEECVKLRTRVFDLEQQNRILSVLFQQRVRMSPSPAPKEIQTNGKAGIAAGKWPSLLSLTCPRSSGSEMSLSSACSDYSTGSHTWAEGRGLSKQCATSRDKRMSMGSAFSNHSALLEQTDFGRKEGHTDGSGPKEKSYPVPAPHCRDCMTSNEDIYSLGVKTNPLETTSEQAAQTNKNVKEGIAAMDANESSSDLHISQSKESKLDVPTDDDSFLHEDSAKPTGMFPSHISDSFTFSRGPTVQVSGSPTESLTRLEENNKGSREACENTGIISDNNNNQERSTDRKSRLDHMKRQRSRPSVEVEARKSDLNIVFQHSATRALSCVSEARQRSSSVEVSHCRDHSNKDHMILKSPQRNQKPKPHLCDSARKAFILRSRSADGGPEQHKHVHSPLHQNLIRAHKSKGHSNAPGHSGPNKRTNHAKLHGSSHVEVEHDEDIAQSSCKSLERIPQRSPLASPVKHSLASKPLEGDEVAKSQTELQITRLPSSNNCVEETIYDNLPCTPKPPQEQLSDVFSSEHRSPSPPPPPGRTTSLLRRTASDSVRTNQSAVQPQGATTGKACSNTTSQAGQISSAVQLQQTNTAPNNQHLPTQLDFERTGAIKEAPAVLFNPHTSRMPVNPVPEAQESAKLLVERTVTYHSGNVAASILPSQNILQRSQQSISEPRLSEVMPQIYSNAYYHSVTNNCQSSTSRSAKMAIPANVKSHESVAGKESGTFVIFGRQNKDDTNPSVKGIQTFQTYICDPQMMHEYGPLDKARRKIETRCNSLDSEPCGLPLASDSGVMLDWGFDEEGWLFKRSVSVSNRPPLKPVMGMNGAKARSQSFGARYMDRPSFNRSGKVRTQIKTHSGSSLNSLGDVLPGSMSCSSSYHCPMNRSLLNNFLIEEGLAVPPHLGSSSERLQSLKHQREQARRLQIEQQFSSAFGEPVCEEPERQSTITTIEEKVMLGIEENLHKSQEQERSSEVKQKSASTLANWFGFRKGKLPVPSSKKMDPPKVKEDKKDQKITSLLGGKQTKMDKKKDRRKSDGKDCSVGRRESHDAVRACISMPCPGMSLNETQGQNDIIRDAQIMNQIADGENGSLVKTTIQEAVIGGMEPKKLTYIKTKTRAPQNQQKEQNRLRLAN